MATREPETGWHGENSDVNHLRGRAFEATCLAATAFGLVSVLLLLLFVANDAFRPFSADAGWLATYAATVLVPLAALAVYYYRLDEPAGEVAYVTSGLPVVGLLLTGGFAVLFIELLSVLEWFALLISLVVAGGLIVAHGRLRPKAALERLAVVLLAPIITVFGLPPTRFNWFVTDAAAALGLDFGLYYRVISLREAIMMLPFVPTDWVMLLLTLVLPVAGAAGWFVEQRRESRRDGLAVVGLTAAVAVLGVVAGPLLGIGTDVWLLIVTFAVLPLGVYVEGVLRRGEGVRGLAFPVAAVLGVVVGSVVTGALGFAGPDPWLDWGFLTSATSRTAADAGIYPSMVGSVMMIIVIVLTTFPVGVGAAIYLEEYAPSQGLMGKFVTLIEINIGNLAGVPSVVYGLLGLALFIRVLQWPQGSVIVAGLAVGLLILPIVIISAQEAIRSVPDSFRQASYGMGATRWQTIRQVVLPEALPGILTGTILALGRAIGETAPLLMIGAAASVRLAPNSFFDVASMMPRQIFSWSSELDPSFRHGVLAAGVITLLAVLLVMNATAIVIRNRYQRTG
ncbi:phosphate ABC transporter permease [Haloarcula hispanica N601]|uniref:Phosphate transport system permease protein PstA n=3 Tax=Haloarcula hispanica TaxID=51589 RepID=V5TMU8_HALHI|nr:MULTISPECIES: phosphate ABC transporter permease PstA [Haloarcula]AEM57671.1 phosphate ABC transporter permease protein [Haloarcula hispanica ATCC 33960]AHB66428.1 phosphate ABC transporter permease [Haloarcula hispanica N601]KZX49180.1 phosphate ABC transporter permease [Haloarcula sp. K1]MUV50654.1 phosphate ABC transporter permease PstA [Haloarcula sp. CBA1122]